MAARAALSLALTLALAPLGAANGIRNVDQPALGTIYSLQAAIDAAADGDLLLVAPGTYQAGTIDGKSLSIVAMPTAGNKKTGPLTIRNLQAGQMVFLAGLSATNPVGVGITLTNNQGFVRLHGLTVTGGKTSSGFSAVAYPGASITSCQRVVIASCTIEGGNPGYLSGELPAPGAPGIASTNSALAIFDSTVRGGEGSEESAPMGGTGGDGLAISGWGAFLSGTILQGGRGGGGDYIGCNAGGKGGDALELSASQVQILDVTLAPGGGGWSSCGGSGGSGSPINNLGGTVTELLGTRRKLTSATLASDAAPLSITLAGEPGDRVWLSSAYEPAYVVLPGLGIWTVRRPTFVPMAPLGTIPASGTLTANVPVHMLPSGAVEGVLVAQALVVDLQNKMFLTSPLHVGVVDAESAPDCDGSQINDLVELFALGAPDCDKNLEIDSCDIASGAQQDCNSNGVPDSCDIASGFVPDCNANHVPDSCDIALGVAQDCNGNTRPDSCDIAMGFSQDVNQNGIPDECEPHTPVTWWVDDDALPGGNGTQSAPFQTIGAGLAASFHGDIVLVRNGLYKGVGNKNLVPGGREVVIRSESGAANCVIDCEGSGRAFHISDGEGLGLRFRGLTIRNGNALSAPADIHLGGAFVVFGGSPRIESCVIENCSGRIGGGIYASSSSLQVRNTLIRNCVAPKFGNNSGSGGAAYISYAYNTAQPAAFVNCVVQGCSVDGSGGGIYYAGTEQLTLSHCSIVENTATNSGGGILAFDAVNGGGCVLFLDNCLLAGNSAVRGGGAHLWAAGLATSGAGLTLSGCTLVQNSATAEGGAFKIASSSGSQQTPLEVYDTIVWNSSAPLGATLHEDTGLAVVTFASCDVQGGTSGFVLGAGSSLTYGPGNIDLDPLFVDADGPDNNPLTFLDNDYRLAAGSPCSDAGDNARVGVDLIDIDSDGNVGELTPLDLKLQPRFVEDPLAPNTGQGTPPLVDLGAYERQP